VLDGLHEDLNRIKKKPYFGELNTNNKPEEQIALESWERHTARNSSIVSDLMHGQYRSELTCPTCDYKSVTFDPFNLLSLPIINNNIVPYNLYFVFNDPEKFPVKLTCYLPSDANFTSLKQSVG